MSMQFTLTSSRWACLPVGSVSYMNTLRIFYAGLDLHIGSSPTQMFRIARTYHAHALTFLDAAARLNLGHLWHRFFSSGGHRTRAINIFKDYELRLNYHPDFVEVPLSSVNFFTNARALANLLTHLLPKSDPSPLFSESTLQWMLSPGSVVHDDPILQRSIQYTKSGLFIESSPEGKPIFGLRDDILGQVAFVDPARNLTFAYVTNHAHGCSVKRDWILKTLIQTIYACL
uniref:Beta-lactamase domain-containing protein 2 n=1 Tax=Schistocephalus solidus TaxID=70667 RepID=A0A0X3Q1Q0_SCHSO